MCVITIVNVLNLLLGMPTFIAGAVLLLVAIREIIKHGMFKDDFITITLSVMLLTLGTLMILIGMNIVTVE